MSKAGILPNELARTNMPVETLPTAPAKVTKPDGTNGSNRKVKISEKAVLPSAATNLFILGYLSSPFCALFLNPFL